MKQDLLEKQDLQVRLANLARQDPLAKWELLANLARLDRLEKLDQEVLQVCLVLQEKPVLLDG